MPDQASIRRGQSTTLGWDVGGSDYNLISAIGHVRGASIKVSPKRTTIYTLDATNQFGRSSSSTTVTVH